MNNCKKIRSNTRLFSDHEIGQIPCPPEDISTPDPPKKTSSEEPPSRVADKQSIDDVTDAGSENASSDPHSSDRSGNLQTRVKRHCLLTNQNNFLQQKAQNVNYLLVSSKNRHRSQILLRLSHTFHSLFSTVHNDFLQRLYSSTQLPNSRRGTRNTAKQLRSSCSSRAITAKYKS